MEEDHQYLNQSTLTLQIKHFGSSVLCIHPLSIHYIEWLKMVGVPPSVEWNKEWDGSNRMCSDKKGFSTAWETLLEFFFCGLYSVKKQGF